MERPTRVHCFFEQSGTFKNEFIKLGIPAEDYDIQNNFGQTDHVVDLFAEIEAAYDGRPSVFDRVAKTDLVLAFFPCIYFCAMSQVAMSFGYRNYAKLSIKEKAEAILKRSQNREAFFRLAVKMFAVAIGGGIRLIMENPWSEQTFLKANFVMPPALVDMDRTRRGDYFRKPTAYWFLNCEPTHGETTTPTPKNKVKSVGQMKQGERAGLCSEERSTIAPQYAHNFICDFILNRPTNGTQLQLF